ncbi:MAG: nitrogen regulation protein NR(I) [Cellvibrionales bacterium]
MSGNRTVWVVDDDRSIRWVMEKALAQAGLDCQSFDSGDAMLDAIAESTPDVVISDIRMPGTDGLKLLATLRQSHPDVPVIITTAHSDLDSAVASYEEGAFEYLPKPFDVDEIVATVLRTPSMRKSSAKPKSTNVEKPANIIGNAPAMQEVFRAIGRLSQSNITVLINGESGTGKELVAQALHRHSPRRHQPFIALNMAAIPKELMESELFGHEKGAFTGAATRRTGRFEQADSGTLFLDEIGDMPAETQTRLLRVLADGEFFRVGGASPVKADVRIIAATHQNLEALVAQGKFREDLFHRINVIRIHIPKLSERAEDIPQLTQYFLGKAAKELEVEEKVLTADASRFLSQLPWPGNVRQLENTCRWLTVMAAGREVRTEDLPPELLTPPAPDRQEDGELSWQATLASWARQRLAAGESNVLRHALPEFERIMIEAALNHTGGRRAEAAETLGWGRNTLTRKIKELEGEADSDQPEEN